MMFTQKKSVGLDIADDTIEVVEIFKQKGGIEVSNVGRTALRKGVVERGVIKEEEALKRALKRVFLQAKPHPISEKNIFFCFPESQVFLHTLEISGKKKKEGDISAEEFRKLDNRQKQSFLKKEVLSNIPLPSDDLVFSYRIILQKEDAIEILLAAASRNLIWQWRNFFKSLNFEIEGFDIESLASFRGLFIEPQETAFCLVDIGASATHIYIFDNKGLRYSRSIKIAGNALTEEVAKALGIDFSEAEAKKKAAGLKDEGSQIFAVLVKTLEPIVKELKTLAGYFEEKTGEKIKEVILIGGSSKLKGIAGYFEANLEIPVKKGKSELFKKKIGLEYIEAAGAALRGIDREYEKRDPLFEILPREESAFLSKKNFFQTLKDRFFRGERKGLPGSLPSRQEEGRQIGEYVAKSRKMESLKITFLIILLVGVFSIALSYIFRYQEKQRKEKELDLQILQYSKTQTFSFKIPVAVDQAEYTADRVRARIFEDTIQFAGDYNEAVAHSRINAGKILKEGEIFWPKPLNENEQSGEAVFPVKVRWLIYIDKEANKLFLAQIDKINKTKINYGLNNIEKITLEPTENEDIFFLSGKITVSLNELILYENVLDNVEQKEEADEGEAENGEEQSSDEQKEEAEKEQLEVVVNQTETGWLRVRQGPGALFEEIGRVYPGQSYVLLEEVDEWYKIELEQGQEGWISTRYAAIK